MSGFDFPGLMRMGRYAAMVQAAVYGDLIDPRYLTSRCPECGDEMSIGAPEDHVTVVDSEETVFVAVGCEGYWVIDPEQVGLPRNGWSDWTSGPTDLRNTN